MQAWCDGRTRAEAHGRCSRRPSCPPRRCRPPRTCSTIRTSQAMGYLQRVPFPGRLAAGADHRDAVPAVGDAGHHPHPGPAARRAHRRDPRPRSATTPTGSPTFAPVRSSERGGAMEPLAGPATDRTVPALLADRAAARGDHPLLDLRRRRAHLRRGRRPGRRRWPRACSPPAPARAPTSGCSTRTARRSSSAWLAAARIGAVERAAQHVLDQRRAAHAAAQRRHRGAARRRRRTGAGTSSAILQRGRARRRPVGRRHRSSSRACPRCAGWCSTRRRSSRPAPTSTTTCWPPPRRPCGPSDRMVIVHTSGSTSAPKGVIHQHGSLIRHLGNLNELRALRARRRAVLQLAVLLDRRLRLLAARARCVAGATLVCSNATDAAGDPRPAGARPARRWSTASPPRSPTWPKDPSFAGRDLSSIRRGQPVADHAGRRSGRPTRSCATTCSA